MSVDKKKLEEIKKICDAINKGDFGGDNKDAVTWLSASANNNIKRFPSGHPALDKALGGGYPIGRFIEIYGPESSGKSTTCLHAIAEFQKEFPNEQVALIDTEYAFDPVYAEALGVEVDSLILSQPDNGEQALNVLRQMIQLGVKFAIVDSVAALVPKAELDGDLGDNHVGRQARLMSAAMRVLTAEAGKAEATVLWTNQTREKIGVTYGSPETTPGGKALKFYTSIRMSIRRVGGEKESGSDEFTANKTCIETKKNKTAPPFKKANILISFGKGFDLISGIFDEAISLKVLKKAGSWIKDFEGNTVGQGKPAIIAKMENEPEFKEWLEAEIKKRNNPEVEEKVEEVAPKKEAKKKKPPILPSTGVNIDEV